MALSDGTRRFKTYGKHRSQVAVSRREWWSTVSETVAGSAASTSTVEQGSGISYSNDGTSPSYRAEKKASSVIALDEDNEDVPEDVQGPEKQMPFPRTQNRSTNTRSRIVDVDDFNSDEEHRPTSSRDSQRQSRATSYSSSRAETPDNRAVSVSARAADQQRGRVISLASDTSEEDKVKPARRKTAVAKKSAPVARKRIIIEDTPPTSPAAEPAELGHVHNLQASQPSEQLATGTAAEESQLVHASPVKKCSPVKPSVLTRKDSNCHHNASSAASSPLKRQAAIVSTPMAHRSKPTVLAKENFNSFVFKPSRALEYSTSSKPPQTPLKTTSSFQPSTYRQPVSIVHARSLASTKHSSSSSSSKSILLPPPRGHNSESAVSWRRPLAPILPVTASRSKAVKVHRGGSSKLSSNEKIVSTSRDYGSASSASSRYTAGGGSSHGSRGSHVVVEIPFGLPRSRSPAPVMKEARKRQTSAQSVSSKSSESSAKSNRPSSPLTSLHREEHPTITHGQPTELEASPQQAGDNETKNPSEGERISSCNLAHVPKAPSPSDADIPREFVPLLEHCDGCTSSGPGEVFDFAAFVAQPTALFATTSEHHKSVRWRKLGEATFSEVFIVSGSPTDEKDLTGTVVKVIPLHMSPEQTAEEEKVEEAFAKADEKVEEVFTSSIDDLAREIRIFRALSLQAKGARKGWPAFKGAYLVKGAYPERLLFEWDLFKESNSKRAENPRPDTFAANQMYALICMDHAGVDLESVKLKTWTEAATILWQVTSALSEAESTLQFEHRDLHWGNILVQRLASDTQAERPVASTEVAASGLPGCLASSNPTVSATIIDFTLSRATVPASTRTPSADQVEILAGGFDDEWMFTGEGDYQYECYRIMKRLVQNNWELYCPATNLVWLHYLVKKLLYDKGLKKPINRAATRSAVIRANLPGTPLRNRTRRGTVAARKGSKTNGSSDASSENQAHDSLLAAEAALEQAIASTLRSLPRSSSLVQMMEGMRLDSAILHEQNDTDLASAADFLKWWREQ